MQKTDIWYDRRGEIIGIRFRDGKDIKTIMGWGTFVIYFDDEGIWGIDIEVAKWDRKPDRVDKALVKAGIEIYGERIHKKKS